MEAKLLLHHEDGFFLYAASSTANNGLGRLLWSQPFHKLRMSSDDGSRLLWLKFDGEPDVVCIHFNNIILIIITIL